MLEDNKPMFMEIEGKWLLSQNYRHSRLWFMCEGKRKPSSDTQEFRKYVIHVFNKKTQWENTQRKKAEGMIYTE